MQMHINGRERDIAADDVAALLLELRARSPSRRGRRPPRRSPSPSSVWRSLEGSVDHRAVRDDRDVVTLAPHVGGADRDEEVRIVRQPARARAGRSTCARGTSTGLSSRIADFNRPFASAGKAGHTILIPPEYANQGSGLIEWKDEARTIPASRGPRSTTGRGNAAPVGNAGERRRDLVETAGHEVGVLKLRDGAEPLHRGADRHADDRLLGDRRVHHPCPRRIGRRSLR